MVDNGGYYSFFTKELDMFEGKITKSIHFLLMVSDKFLQMKEWLLFASSVFCVIPKYTIINICILYLSQYFICPSISCCGFNARI